MEYLEEHLEDWLGEELEVCVLVAPTTGDEEQGQDHRQLLCLTHGTAVGT